MGVSAESAEAPGESAVTAPAPGAPAPTQSIEPIISFPRSLADGRFRDDPMRRGLTIGVVECIQQHLASEFNDDITHLWRMQKTSLKFCACMCAGEDDIPL
jgi:hypothetical protein